MNYGDAYAKAVNAKTLKLETHKTGDADTLIAAGLSRSVLGFAIMRLQTEWDCVRRAYIEGKATKLETGSLNAYRRVEALVYGYAEVKSMKNPRKVVDMALSHYLDRLCHDCNGVGKVDKHVCRTCGGTGKRPESKHADVCELLIFMDASVSAARTQAKRMIENGTIHALKMHLVP